MPKNRLKIFNTEERQKLIDALASVAVKELIEKTTKATDEETGTFTGIVVSTEHMDRQGEIVMQAGIDPSMYLKNPVVLNSHSYYGIENIVGTCTKLYPGTVDGKAATLADGKFAPTDQGQIARKLWEGKFLNTASIGFIPTEFDQKNQAIITKCEMLEFSLVPVPANAYAARLNALGLGAEMLRSKGFEIATKADELGDACSTDDGTEGVLAEDPKDPDGPLVCVPNEVKAAEPEKPADPTGEDDDLENDDDEDNPYHLDPTHSKLVKALASDLEAEHTRHVKAVSKNVSKLEEHMTASKAIDDAEKKTVAVNEAMGKFKDKMAAEHATHLECIGKCMKTYGEALGALDPAEKTLTVTVDGKEMMKRLHDALTAMRDGDLKSAIGSLEIQLKGLEGEEPAEVGANADKESLNKGSKDGAITDMDEFVLGREILRSIRGTVDSALKSYNERGRKNAHDSK